MSGNHPSSEEVLIDGNGTVRPSLASVRWRRRSGRGPLSAAAAIVLLFLSPVFWISCCSARSTDPKLVNYPGDVHFAVMINTNYNNDAPGRGTQIAGNQTNGVDSTCSETIHPDGVYHGMATVWAAHQVNLKRGHPNQLKIGIYLYDGCSRAEVVQRQSVRILAHLNDVQTKACREPKAAPLFGAIIADKTSQASLSLFKSFKVPVVLAKEPMLVGSSPDEPGSAFSVASSLKYMSKGVMALLKRLNWASAVMVISDDVPQYYSEVFEEIARRVHFNVVPSGSRTSSPGSLSPATNSFLSTMDSQRLFKREPTAKADGSDSSRAPEAAKNTILFLTASESLQLLTSLRSNLPLPGHDKFNWVLIVNEDISERVKGILSSSQLTEDNVCRTKAMFLLVPNLPSTKEFHRYFLNEVNEFGNNSVHPLIAKYASGHLDKGHPGASVANTVKAVWTLSMAFRKFEQQHCSPFVGKAECLEKLKAKDLFAGVYNETKHLDDQIFGSSISTLEGYKLSFDRDNLLKTNKYSLKLITSDCKLLDAGFFTDDSGLLLDEIIFATLKVGDDQVMPPEPQFVNSSSASNDSGSSRVSGARPQLVASTTFYTPTHNDSEVSVTTSSSVATSFSSHRPVTNGRSFVKPVDMDLAEDQISVMPFLRNHLSGGNKVTTGAHLTSAKVMVPANLSKDKTPRNLVTHTTQNVRRHLVFPESALSPPESVVAHSVASSKNGRTIDLQERVRTSSSGVYHHHKDGPVSSAKRRPTSLVSWLGRPWSLVILTFSLGGALLTLYTFTFLLMKACEGALGRTNQSLASLHLFSIILILVAAILYVFEPTPFMCSLRASAHNVSLALLIGIMLLRVMYLRAQMWIGLGGKIPKLNQFLTLVFIFGIQVALEVQTWKYLSPWDNALVGPNQQLPNLCTSAPKNYLSSQLYLLFVLSVLFLFSWTARRQPFASNEGNHVFIASSIILPIFALCIVLCEQFSDEVLTSNGEATRNAMTRDIVNSVCMIGISFVSLLSIFGPLLYTIHKYGVLPRKSASYADSLSTAFTIFRGGVGGGLAEVPILSADASSQHGSSRSSSVLGGSGIAGGHRTSDASGRRNKPAKRLDSGPIFSSATNSYNYFTGPNSNFRMSPRVTPLEADYLRRSYQPFSSHHHQFGSHSHQQDFSISAMVQPSPYVLHHGKPRNPLYGEDGAQYRSAYP